MAKITKAEIKRRQDAVDAKNKVFWLWESIQRAENGGHPAPNDAGIGHGEPVYVVKKRELMEFALGVRDIINRLAQAHAEKASFDEMLLVFEADKIAARILEDNQFVEPLRKLGTPRPDR